MSNTTREVRVFLLFWQVKARFLQEYGGAKKDQERFNPNRKEVKTMTYSKPELLSVNAALEIIQGFKGTNYEADDPIDATVSAAYEVDE